LDFWNLSWSGKTSASQPQLCPVIRYIRAKIKHAIDEEEALAVNDFVFRRNTMGLGPYQGRKTVETVAQEMAFLLNWSDTEKGKTNPGVSSSS
jgi:glycerol-3-phosphate dehydrogenase